MLIIGQRVVDRILVMFQTFYHPQMNPRGFTINDFADEATMLSNCLTYTTLMSCLAQVCALCVAFFSFELWPLLYLH